MKIMIISDLHIDINKKYLQKEEFGFVDKIKDVDIILNCGDTSGSNFLDINFLNKIKSKIIDKKLNTRMYTINGNHSWYDYDIESIDRTTGILRLREEFQYAPVEFLENNCSMIGEYIIFGCALYTNFNLFGNSNYYKSISNMYMNDFKYVYDYKINDEIKRVTPYDYTNYFKNSLKMLNEICDSYPDKKIIVLTHFAPSEQSISKQYIGSELNPAYASNLEEFILKHKNIKLWAHGHIHGSSDYNIGECRIICEPYGYCGYENVVTPSNYNGKIIEI